MRRRLQLASVSFFYAFFFFHSGLSQGNIVFDEEQSKHCVRVLRLTKGDRVTVLDGKGHSAVGVIIADHPKKCELEISKVISHAAPRVNIHVAVAPTKSFDRMEWFLEKAIEIGIQQISFIQCENSERIRINMDRCSKIAIASIKQSRQWFLPAIHDIRPLSEVLEATASDDIKMIGWCGADTLHTPASLLASAPHRAPGRIMIMIGPEGDFTEQELQMARENGWHEISFGESRLRTETAALFALCAVKVLTDR